MDWAIQLMEQLGYVGIFVIVLLENLIPPIPSEVVLPFAGFMTQQGVVSVAGVVVAATLGSVAGALVLYWVGALVGSWRIYRFVARHQRWLTIRPEHLTQAGNWFDTYGTVTVFLCRMVPIMRSVISIPAGLVRMPMGRFVVYTFLGSAVWNTALVVAGAILGASWREILRWLDYYRNVVLIVAVLVGVGVAVRYVVRRRK
ncbi:MAG: DedA family protein [Firmicutes bacterium]|nr:DedA family protein [Bacillota bacterium]